MYRQVRVRRVRYWSAVAGMVRLGVVRQGASWRGAVWFGRLGWQGKVRYGQVRLVKAWQVWMGLFRHGTLWLGKAGMEGHRVVRLDVVCYVIVGLGVSGFAWFGSVGRARYGKFRKVMVRSVQAWRGLARQARLGVAQ